MKALVLCGGIPQIALINELKKRGVVTILADMNEKVSARQYADDFFQVSVLDVEAVKNLAIRERVDFVITVCADQVLEVMAQVSEELGLPCYIGYETARKVSSKQKMKKIFVDNGIPTSNYIILKEFDENKIKNLSYPLIVKPIDSYSSRGVKKVFNKEELVSAFVTAIEISRTKTAIIEEFVEGEELTVDAYIEDGWAHILSISNIDKIPGNNRFVICRTRYLAQITDVLKEQIEIVVNQIAKAFELKNSPMLVQMITDGKKISVVEFCARTGGGDKFRLIEKVSHFDVIKAVVDLTLGEKPHVDKYQLNDYIVNEFLYTNPCTFDHLEGFEEMKREGIINEYFQLKSKGAECSEIKSSGDRVAFYMIQASTVAELREKEKMANKNLKIIDVKGNDTLRHDLIATW